MVCRSTPFPYKVAKSLSPDMFRNVEYDAWLESKKSEFMSFTNNSPVVIDTNLQNCIHYNRCITIEGSISGFIPRLLELAILMLKYIN